MVADANPEAARETDECLRWETREWNKHTRQLLSQYNLTLTTVLYKAVSNHLRSVTVSLASVSFCWNWLIPLTTKYLHTEQRGFKKKKRERPTLTSWCSTGRFPSQPTTGVRVTGERGQTVVFLCREEGNVLVFFFLMSMHQKNAQQKQNKTHDVSKK